MSHYGVYLIATEDVDLPIADNLLRSNRLVVCRLLHTGSNTRGVKLARVGLQGGVGRVFHSHSKCVVGGFAQTRNREAEACPRLLGGTMCLSVACGRKSNARQLSLCIENQRAEYFTVFANFQVVGGCRLIRPPYKHRLVV